MKKLDSIVKYKNKKYIIHAIKTEPVKDSKDKVIYCLVEIDNSKKKIEVDAKELK